MHGDEEYGVGDEVGCARSPEGETTCRRHGGENAMQKSAEVRLVRDPNDTDRKRRMQKSPGNGDGDRRSSLTGGKEYRTRCRQEPGAGDEDAP